MSTQSSCLPGYQRTSFVLKTPGSGIRSIKKRHVYSNSGILISQRIIIFFRKKAYTSGNVLLRSEFFLSGKEICGLIVIEHGRLKLEYAFTSATGLEMLQKYTKD